MCAASYIFAEEGAAGSQSAKPQTGVVRSVYQPVGMPADPRVDVRWNRYHDYAQSTEILKKLAETFPKYAKLRSLGKSTEQREMWLLTITNSDSGKEDEKPGFWIDAGIHANEVQATEVALYTAWFLLETYGRNDRVTALVDKNVFYIVPMMSPDSRDKHMYEPNTTHSPRTGQTKVDDDQDGLTNEDRPDDLDGDGHITQMRSQRSERSLQAASGFPGIADPLQARRTRLVYVAGARRFRQRSRRPRERRRRRLVRSESRLALELAAEARAERRTSLSVQLA
ncbi:MAG: M14 family zinc carboxypeptidase [Pirellulales bacterium]